jgi:hypothetical protein
MMSDVGGLRKHSRRSQQHISTGPHIGSRSANDPQKAYYGENGAWENLTILTSLISFRNAEMRLGMRKNS